MYPHSAFASSVIVSPSLSKQCSQPLRHSNNSHSSIKVLPKRCMRMQQTSSRSATSHTPNTKTSPKKASANDFTWTNQWYAVAWTADVPPGRIVPFSLFDHSFIVYKDTATGLYVVMDNVCPHRAAPLSEGRLLQRRTKSGVLKTHVECTYHGWKFDCNGTCVDVPHAPADARLPPRANVSGIYATVVSSFDLIFMWYGDRLKADESKLPIPQRVVDPKYEGSRIWIRPTMRKFPLEMATIVENLVDPAHVPFSHHGTSEGDRTFIPRNLRLRVHKREPANGTFESVMTMDGTDRTLLKVSLIAGTLVYYGVDQKSGEPRTDLMLYCVPSKRNEVTVFLLRYRYFTGYFFRTFRPRVPLWIDHAQNNLTFDGDTPLIQWQEAFMKRGKRDWTSSYFMSTSTMDALVADFRRWNSVVSKSMPYESELPQSQDEEALVERMRRDDINDRYRWHVKDCVACTSALRNLRMLQVLTGAVAMVTAAAAISIGIVIAALGGRYIDMRACLVRGMAICTVVTVLLSASVMWVTKGIAAMTYTDRAHVLHQQSTPLLPWSSDEY